MLIREIPDIIGGKLICGKSNELIDKSVAYGFSSDLMSDVLTLDSDGLVLITGLTTVQAIRTAEMSEISVIVFVRNKKITPEMIELAEELSIVLISSEKSMFSVSGLLYQAGLKAVY